MVAICTIVPISLNYFRIIEMGCYYVPHFLTGFFTLSLVYCYGDSFNKKKWLYFGFAALLSLIACLGGIRQLVITYFPLFLATVVLCFTTAYKQGWSVSKKSAFFRYFKIALVCLGAGGIGFIINDSILSEKYHFLSWGDINFTTLKYDQLRTVVDDILITLGFVSEPISLKALLSNGACGLIVILTVWSIIVGLSSKASERLKLLTTFFICNLSVFFLLFAFTDMNYAYRYNFPVLVFTFPLITLAIHESDFGKLPQISRQILLLVFIGMILMRGGYQYIDLMEYNRYGVLSEELIETSEFLKDSDYKNGYASFWNANILTEFSNGELTMYVWNAINDDGTEFNTIKDIDHLFPWLQSTKHNEIKPKGKVFALYRKNEIDNCNWKQGLHDSDILFKTSNIVVYGYDSYSEMKETCN